MTNHKVAILCPVTDPFGNEGLVSNASRLITSGLPDKIMHRMPQHRVRPYSSIVRLMLQGSPRATGNREELHELLKYPTTRVDSGSYGQPFLPNQAHVCGCLVMSNYV